MMNLSDIERVVFRRDKIALSKNDFERVAGCHDFLAGFARDKIIYGINTGFGPMAQYRIDDDKLTELQYNIIRSHSCGAGAPLDEADVRAAMIARLQTFVQGKSGVHPELVELLTAFINKGITPFIPQHGGVGASGDLVQLAHMALALIGEGEVFFRGKKVPAAEAMAEAGLKPLSMHIREGLAVTNGTSVMTGMGMVNMLYAKKLLGWSIAASVMMNEVAASYDDFMSEEINGAKRHAGQNAIAEAMRRASQGGRCMKKRDAALYNGINGEKVFGHKVQPYYSLRCVPQILGPVYDELAAVEKMLADELNSADDNPIVDPETRNVYHGGNFHGDYVSLGMDKLKIAVTKLTMLAERQLNYLLHDKLNEVLPPFLNMGTLGLTYGFQALQFTATSTTAECQALSNPMYVHSIPNNNDNQDIVSMGTNSAILARRVVDNSFQVMAIHMMALAQAVDILGAEDKLADKTREVYRRIREITPAFVEDEPKYGDIAAVIDMLKTGPSPIEL